MRGVLLGLVLAVGACTPAQGAVAGALGWAVWRKTSTAFGLCDDKPPVWVVPAVEASSDAGASDGGAVEATAGDGGAVEASSDAPADGG